MDNNLLAYKLLNSAYDDYITARYLLNQEKYLLQAVTLASTAVEKYIKSVLAVIGQGSRMRFHLHQIDKLKALLNDHYTDFTRFFDPYFLEILGLAYQHRYYDVEQKATIGFFINQFLGELDFVVYYVEYKIFPHGEDANGQPLKTAYKAQIEQRSEDLFRNNYILNQISKKEHMEKSGNAYALHLDHRLLHAILITGKNIAVPYEGRMIRIHVQSSDEAKSKLST
jgi:HEPN domain-containing protein